MNDAELGNALRRLPRVTAPPRFTSDVLRALRPVPQARVAWRMAFACAMAMILVVGLYAGVSAQREKQKLNALRAERQRIETELQRVKAIADDAQPVVVLQNGDTRVIMQTPDSPYQQTKQVYY